MDFGVHVVDFYHYLLKPRWTFVSATHDGFNGPEGLAEIELLANDAPIYIRLSRYHPQANVGRISFERAEIVVNVYDAGTYSIRLPSRKLKPIATSAESRDYAWHGEPLLLNFLAASQRRELPICDAASSIPVILVLDEIYRLANRYPPELGRV
jgi:hypothetical protein